MTPGRTFFSSSGQSPRPAPERRTSELAGERTLPPVVAPLKLLVYSHDTFGLGNIRRMIAICEHLCARFPRMTVLILTGSPMLHSFRLTPGIDYVKLPCLSRDGGGVIGVKYLNLTLDSTVGLRRELILSTVMNLRPDIFLVDKKPGGIAGELEQSLKALKANSPETSIVLLLRDILDDATVTIDQWTRQHSYDLLQEYYKTILVTGLPEVFNVPEEYHFPPALRAKVHFCGYIKRNGGPENRESARQQLRLSEWDRLVLVTAGGGEDGFTLLRSYLEGVAAHQVRWKTVIVTGPELIDSQKREVRRLAECCKDVHLIEFTDQLMMYMKAADVVVSMAGYNTICEVLSLRKRAVVVPRVEPVQEQRMRAERMARLGLFKMVHPADMTPDTLIAVVRSEMEAVSSCQAVPARLDLNALPRIGALVQELVGKTGDRTLLAHNEC
jgi:predicted glycosyltransferase